MKTNWALIAITATFTLVLSINPLSYAWHENLGIDANKAAELYQTKPNDPAIVQWKNALQLAINGMDKCFYIQDAISCQSLIPIIVSNCKSHPNTLLACNDARLPQYPSILKKAQEAQIKAQKEAEEEQKKAEEAKQKAFETEIQELKKKYYSKAPEAIGSEIIDRCIENPYGTLQYYAKSVFCDGELRSLQKDCQTKSSQYNYCEDQRLVGYLKQNIVNSTVTPYSNFRGNSSSSNSTYP
jgi:hypothetical protein